MFNDYCDHNYVVSLRGFPIFDGDGEKIGHVDRINLGRNSVRIEGWCTALRVSLAPPSAPVWQRPAFRRADVEAELKLKEVGNTGFNITAHGSPKNLILSLNKGATTLQIMLPDATLWTRLKAIVRIRASFVNKTFRASPTLVRAYFQPNVVNKSKAKHAMGVANAHSLNVLEERFFEKIEPVRSAEMLTLIMPVYNAFDVLGEALKRIEQNTDLPWRMILVEDCSTDMRVRPMLRDWAKLQNVRNQQVTLLENTKNRGFIESVNRALKKALKFENHVVLINSDALVPKDWARRLIHPILNNPKIASVTPLSNDAEIFNVPFVGKRSDLERGEAEIIDDLLLENLSCDVYANAPTGVGFCMALNRQFLQRIPQFDQAFGKGYGEEVDWCCRVSKQNGTHVVQPNLFVEHRGGASFGSTAKHQAILRNNKIISARYPKYDDAVRRFVATDPIKSARLFAALAYLSAKQDIVDVFIAHSLGGGAEIYLKQRIADANRKGNGVVVLRLGGHLRWQIEVHIGGDILRGETDSTSLIERYLSALPDAHIIYSCAVGDRDPVALPKLITSWRQTKSHKLTFLVHDYFAISPSYCLLDSDGIYRFAFQGDNLDEAHAITTHAGQKISSAQWRSRWLGLLQNADSIECFSQNSLDIMKSAFPEVKTPLTIKPHEPSNIEAVRRLTPHNDPSLGVLGSIGVQKGADCVQRLSKVLPYGCLKRITLVGQIDPRFKMGASTKEIGRYERSEITALAEQNQISAWLIPSIWPETYSYAIHEALATGLPVFCFDLGAQQEAAQKLKNGYVLPLSWANKPDLILQRISEVLENVTHRQRVHSKAKGRGRRSVAARAKSAS